MTPQAETPLTAVQLEQWRHDGYIAPIQAMPAVDMARHVAAFEGEFAHGDAQVTNRHCDLPAIAGICRRVDLWGRLATLLGPDMVLWRTNLFLGNPSLQWHEDQHARLLGGGFGISALLALTDGSCDNCTLLAPGSHRLSAEEKERRYGLRAERQSGGNIRYTGRVAESDFTRMPLQAGQCLIFHPELLHASSGLIETQNRPISSRRMNLVFRVASADTRVAPTAYARDAPVAAGPVLIRGIDRTGTNTYVSLACA